MAKRDDIESILVIGSGPIIIGQACEFDYSGTQACRVLRREGYRVVLANSNPATVMTDPEQADATYVEPLDVDVLTRIIERERPDAVLPTLGGQTGLNLAMELFHSKVLQKFDVEMIGANAQAIATAENRSLFKAAMTEIGLDVPRSGVATSMDEAFSVIDKVGLPVIVRPAYILGGRGTGIATTMSEFEAVARKGIAASPVGEILIEESIVGWKEFELEVMRDRQDNCVVVCSIENVDPMGVHTGDSITVAPAMTLSDVEYQQMRNAAFAALRRVGVETGGSNVQFAVDPETGRQVVIEMNPRVSRSSALASKATGFPIAKIAAQLAVGYTLNEITNDITGKTPASFEPALDYVVVKIPRWAFEKFPDVPVVLGTSMQSVGEVMAIGRTFPEALQKGLRSLEHGRFGLNADPSESCYDSLSDHELLTLAKVPTPERIFQLEVLLRRGVPVQDVYKATSVDTWFLQQIVSISSQRLEIESEFAPLIKAAASAKLAWKRAKQLGFSDSQIAYLCRVDYFDVRAARIAAGVVPTYKTVDTCAAEFESTTPYHYSTYEDTDELTPHNKPTVVICGSGPNRIGQGIEFDYCCVHASQALRAAGYATVMVNCNPETVSTDYDTSDQLFFEPLTVEDVSNVIDAVKPVGVILSLGGQTPLGLAEWLPPEMVLGTSSSSIDIAEDRELWSALCDRLGIAQPAGVTVTSESEALAAADRIGYPVLVRPSYVLGGRAMAIVYDDLEISAAVQELTYSGLLGREELLGNEGGLAATRPVLVDRFLEGAIEVDVDAVRDIEGDVFIGAVMEHVEEAGVHSGDSACFIPPTTLDDHTVKTISEHTVRIAEALRVVGPINVQYAVKDGSVFVIEANLRASRTLPFVAKATGVPIVKVAARLMLGATIEQLRLEKLIPELAGLSCVQPDSRGGAPLFAPDYVAVKEAVLPFNRFPEADALLGPEMRSTGEVMAMDITPGLAFIKAQRASGVKLPDSGTVFISAADRDKPMCLAAARIFSELGYSLVATSGTAAYLRSHNVNVAGEVAKIAETRANGSYRSSSDVHDAVELIESGKVDFVINTPRGRGSRADGAYIRFAAGRAGLPLFTTSAAGLSAAKGLKDMRTHEPSLRSLQSYHKQS